MNKLVLLLVSAVVLGGCTLGATPAPTPTATPDTGSAMMEETPGEAIAVVDELGVVEVKGLNFTYDIKEIRVKKGQKLTVTFTNTEGFHDFNIDELDVATEVVPQGESVEIEIPTDEAGTYEYYCSVGEHRAQGMWGTLIIEE